MKSLAIISMECVPSKYCIIWKNYECSKRCPSPNDFYFSRSKSIIPYSKLRPWPFWLVDSHADVNEN